MTGREHPTLYQWVDSMDAANLSGAGALLFPGRVLSEHHGRRWLRENLSAFQHIQQRLALVPVPEVTCLVYEAAWAGGFLPWQKVPGRLSATPALLRDLLERYFLGTVGSPVWRPLGVQAAGSGIILFPEIGASCLRHAPASLPPLFTIQDPSVPFLDALNALREGVLQCPSPDDLEDPSVFSPWAVGTLAAGVPGLPDFEPMLAYLHVAFTGEARQDRRVRSHPRPVRRWENLSDVEQGHRVLHHFLAFPDGLPQRDVESRLLRRAIRAARGLHTEHWYAPGTLSPLAILQELCDGSEPPQNPDVEGPAKSPRTVASLETLVRDLARRLTPLLYYSGIVETAVSRGRVVAERLTHTGTAILSMPLKPGIGD